MLRRELARLQADARLARIQRATGYEDIQGYVRHVGDVVTIEVFIDFRCDGLALVRAQDVRDVRISERSAFYERVIAEEELRLVDPLPPDLDSYRAVLEWAARRDELVSIECGPTIGESWEFWIGRVEKCSDRSVALRYLDTSGEWDDEPLEIPLDAITELGLLTPYLKMYRKHAAPYPH